METKKQVYELDILGGYIEIEEKLKNTNGIRIVSDIHLKYDGEESVHCNERLMRVETTTEEAVNLMTEINKFLSTGSNTNITTDEDSSGEGCCYIVEKDGLKIEKGLLEKAIKLDIYLRDYEDEKIRDKWNETIEEAELWQEEYDMTEFNDVKLERAIKLAETFIQDNKIGMEE